ncbi:MAG: glutathione S-transferase [Pseudomonadota bacterium]|nr:glutathione S-transferase [Pseudomonadota bacterium]
MLKLCGFAASNYHNKVKLALLEKGVPFEDVLTWIGQTDPAASPLGKVPYAITDDGPISESTVILEYLEARYPQTPLLPANPYEAAKVRELVRYIELHLELEARKLYPEAFFGGKVSDAAKAKVGEQLEKSVAAFGRLLRCAPYLAGSSFTLADCAAAVHLPLVISTCKIIYGRDLLAELPLKAYLQHIGERPTVQRINADRKANTELLMARMRG